MKKDIETIEKNQSEIKITIPERENTLDRINISLDEAEHGISNLQDKVTESTQS